MKVATLLLLLSLSAASNSQSQGIRLVRDVDDGKAVDELVVVGEAGSSYSAMRKLALESLAKYRDTRTLVQLVIAPDEDAGLRAIVRGRVHGLGYGSSIDHLKAAGFVVGPIGRLFWRSGAGAFTYSSGEDLRTELLAGAANPLVIMIGNQECEVLHVRLSQPSDSAQKTTVSSLSVFVRVKQPLESRLAAQLVERAKGWSNSTSTFVTIMRDAWNFDDFGYPELLPWVKATRLPTPSEYDQDLASQMLCIGRNGQISCNGKIVVP